MTDTFDPKPIFDEARRLLKRGFTPAEVKALDRAINKARGLEEPKRGLSHPDLFFASLRAGLAQSSGLSKPLSLTQGQVDGVNALLEAGAHWPLGWMAYGLGTAWHESFFEPIHERGGRAYLSKYDTGKLAQALGNTPQADGDGILYAGRGFVQLTGRTNYRKAGEFLGLDLLANPDLALDREVAARILIWGMETGAFTGRALSDYVDDQGDYDQFLEARRVVNGVDQRVKIARHALAAKVALEKGGWG